MPRSTPLLAVSFSALVLAGMAGCGGDATNVSPTDSGSVPPDVPGTSDAAPREDATSREDAAPDAAKPDAGVPDAAEVEECAEREEGAPCGETTDIRSCIRAYACRAGVCAPVFALEGASCGPDVTGPCDLPDTCDAAGVCVARSLAEGTACGDPTADTCNGADTCDGAGVCRPNYAAQGTPCGDPTAATCSGSDACDGAGVCVPNDTPDGTSCYDCGAGLGSCTSCNDAVCQVRETLCAPPSTTLFASNAAGNNHRGNMFDLTALHTVTIERFDASPMGNATIEVYYRPGPYAGFESNASAWTRIGSAAVAYTGGYAPVPLPVRVTIPAGQTYAFYVTSAQTSVALNYSNGDAEGAAFASDANLVFRQGVGLEYPFTQGTGALYRPRIWNGAIHYSTPSVSLSTTGPYADATAQGVMFDVGAITQGRLSGLDLELVTGAQDLTVYFRRGTFVGHEGSSQGWQPLATLLGVESLGGGARTPVHFSDVVEVAAGETVGFYVNANQADRLRVTTGGAAGDQAAANAELRMNVGRSVGAFGPAGAPTTIRGAVHSAQCLQP